MEITYGNQGWEHYSYDSLDRLTEKYYYDTNESVYYYYDPNGNLYKVYDEFSDTQNTTDYDLAGRVVGSTLTNETGRKILASANIDYHDKKGTVESQQVTLERQGTVLCLDKTVHPLIELSGGEFLCHGKQERKAQQEYIM